MAEDGDAGFEERMSWLLPTRVLDEADCDHSKPKEYLKNQRHQQRDQYCIKSPRETLVMQHSKSSLKAHHHRPKYPANWAAGGPGMQAIFLDSGRRSTGTGVFLPQRAGTHDIQSTKKPACSPVLLPSRVVQALNLNVHELGLQIKPQRDLNNAKAEVERKKVGKDASTQCCVISQSRSSSPEIFLPKEWTY